MKCRKGFTLIELVVIIAIVGIIAAAALPFFVNMSNQAQIAKEDATIAAVTTSIELQKLKDAVS